MVLWFLICFLFSGGVLLQFSNMKDIRKIYISLHRKHKNNKKIPMKFCGERPRFNVISKMKLDLWFFTRWIGGHICGSYYRWGTAILDGLRLCRQMALGVSPSINYLFAYTTYLIKILIFCIHTAIFLIHFINIEINIP